MNDTNGNGIFGNSRASKEIIHYAIVDCSDHMLSYRGKKILIFSLVPRASEVKGLLVLLPNNLSEMLSNKLVLNFLLARRTLGENICLSCLKFYLSRAPGQVIFSPLSYMYIIEKSFFN